MCCLLSTSWQASSLEITSLIHFSVLLIDTDPLGREYTLDHSIVTGGWSAREEARLCQEWGKNLTVRRKRGKAKPLEKYRNFGLLGFMLKVSCMRVEDYPDLP